MKCASLLPSNRSELMHATEQAGCQHLDTNVIRRSHNPDLCDEHWLPVIAFTKSIGRNEGWSLAESEEAKRNLLKNAAEIHRTRGTNHAIRVFFRSMGLGEVEILENVGYLRYDGTKTHDSTYIYGGDDNSTWATYKIKLNRLITVDQAELIREILGYIAPARDELISIDYQKAALRYNGEKTYNSQYNHGEA